MIHEAARRARERARAADARLSATTRDGVLRLECTVCRAPIGVDAFDAGGAEVLMEYTCDCGTGIVCLEAEAWENAIACGFGPDVAAAA